jgi:hypothetical protein
VVHCYGGWITPLLVIAGWIGSLIALLSMELE